MKNTTRATTPPAAATATCRCWRAVTTAAGSQSISEAEAAFRSAVRVTAQ